MIEVIDNDVAQVNTKSILVIGGDDVAQVNMKSILVIGGDDDALMSMNALGSDNVGQTVEVVEAEELQGQEDDGVNANGTEIEIVAA